MLSASQVLHLERCDFRSERLLFTKKSTMLTVNSSSHWHPLMSIFNILVSTICTLLFPLLFSSSMVYVMSITCGAIYLFFVFFVTFQDLFYLAFKDVLV